MLFYYSLAILGGIVFIPALFFIIQSVPHYSIPQLTLGLGLVLLGIFLIHFGEPPIITADQHDHVRQQLVHLRIPSHQVWLGFDGSTPIRVVLAKVKVPQTPHLWTGTWTLRPLSSLGTLLPQTTYPVTVTETVRPISWVLSLQGTVQSSRLEGQIRLRSVHPNFWTSTAWHLISPPAWVWQGHLGYLSCRLHWQRFPHLSPAVTLGKRSL
ncbi:MAG: hypothetical protein M1415_05505 [Firmicutes bacterium]|nr:hypothetical protein [Bacillota bacterium]